MGDEENISIFLVFFAGLLAITLVLSKFLHERPILGSVFPEAAMVLCVGMAAGFVIHLILGPSYYAKREIEEAAGDDAVVGDDAAGDDNGQFGDDDLESFLSFSPEIFFIALLPPIIFNSGLRIGPLFFRHIQPILLFSIVGTTISALSLAVILKLVLDSGACGCGGFEPSFTELLAYGALLSSTDPISVLAVFQAKKVDPQVFYLVFGESVLNDGA